ncbi:hypothetical protein [Agaribacillus aureus]
MFKLMRFNLLLIIITFVSFGAIAQSNPKESEEYKLNKAVYLQAKKYNDIGVAKNALYKLIVLDPNDASLLDSLVLMYFDYNQHAPSLLVSMDILKRDPGNLVALEISATSYENLQLYDKALTAYESLYLRNNNLYTMYKISFLQFNLKRYSESKTSADIILKNEKAEEFKIVFNPDRNTSEEVTMKAAVLNLKGLIAKQEGNKEEARKLFTEAVADGNPFTFAQQNLASLDEN